MATELLLKRKRAGFPLSFHVRLPFEPRETLGRRSLATFSRRQVSFWARDLAMGMQDLALRMSGNGFRRSGKCSALSRGIDSFVKSMSLRWQNLAAILVFIRPTVV